MCDRAICDSTGTPAVVLLLIAASPTTPPGKRESAWVAKLAARLTPLLV
ncbi:hypothetical protein [Leekyejoonella antrihumi]|nr:hypothetical protein [Leekyejoonella antrihumi]